MLHFRVQKKPSLSFGHKQINTAINISNLSMSWHDSMKITLHKWLITIIHVIQISYKFSPSLSTFPCELSDKRACVYKRWVFIVLTSKHHNSTMAFHSANFQHQNSTPIWSRHNSIWTVLNVRQIINRCSVPFPEI